MTGFPDCRDPRWKWEVRQAGVLEIGLIENILEFGNSPDFGVHAAWTQRF